MHGESYKSQLSDLALPVEKGSNLSETQFFIYNEDWRPTLQWGSEA